MLKYETDLKISDTDALRKEVDEIFAVLKVDAENGQFRSAIVSANEKPTGLILKNSKRLQLCLRETGRWPVALSRRRQAEVAYSRPFQAGTVPHSMNSTDEKSRLHSKSAHEGF
jgi:hypothetical protein